MKNVAKFFAVLLLVSSALPVMATQSKTEKVKNGIFKGVTFPLNLIKVYPRDNNGKADKTSGKEPMPEVFPKGSVALCLTGYTAISAAAAFAIYKLVTKNKPVATENDEQEVTA